ncbi:MAG TPA: hypothetical protein VEI58_07900, partial [Chthoniobacterales bacterium]|nr:hypothetical protein [Chthoniobacterales bacterium]
MTIQQFIAKHSLSPVQLGGWRPAVFLTDEPDDPARGFDDQYEFYANADRTIWVPINRTRGVFRIVHADMLMAYTNWE